MKLYLVTEALNCFMEEDHICVAFTKKDAALEFVEYIENTTEKEIFMDSIPVDDEAWDIYGETVVKQPNEF